MLEKFRPDIMADSLNEVSITTLKEKGIVGIIIDLDNTLTNWNERFLSKEACFWLNEVENQGIKLCVLSNSTVMRIKETINEVGIPFVPYALKPRKKGFLKAMEILNTKPNNTAVIGDQLFTDILGGKRLGLTTILIKPRSKKEFFGTKLMRKVEKIILSKF